MHNALHQGYRIQFHGLYEFSREEGLFDDYIHHFYPLKLQNDAFRPVYKLLLNSLYGYLARFPAPLSTKSSSLFQSPSFFSHLAIAAAITAYARLRMSHYLLNYQKQLYYMDTDSLFLDCPLPASELGEDLGQLRCQDQITQAIFLAPKFYAYRTRSGEEKIRSAGFPTQYLQFSDYERSLRGELRSFTYQG